MTLIQTCWSDAEILTVVIIITYADIFVLYFLQGNYSDNRGGKVVSAFSLWSNLI